MCFNHHDFDAGETEGRKTRLDFDSKAGKHCSTRHDFGWGVPSQNTGQVFFRPRLNSFYAMSQTAETHRKSLILFSSLKFWKFDTPENHQQGLQ